MDIKFHTVRNEKVVKRMKLGNEHVVLTRGDGDSWNSVVFSLYKKKNITDGLDTYEKIASKRHGAYNATLGWVNKNGRVDLIRQKKGINKNIVKKPWGIDSFNIVTDSIKAKFEERNNKLSLITGNFILGAKELTPKEKRAIRLLNKVT